MKGKRQASKPLRGPKTTITPPHPALKGNRQKGPGDVEKKQLVTPPLSKDEPGEVREFDNPEKKLPQKKKNLQHTSTMRVMRGRHERSKKNVAAHFQALQPSGKGGGAQKGA